VEMAITALIFVLFTALLVLRHTRRTAATESVAEQAASVCPRCKAEIPAGTPACPGCGAPPQVFDVVEAPVEAEREEGPEPSEQAHAVVRADLCVGCGTCADACPEDGALFLRDKVAVVDRAACVGHGSCVQACPVSAIFVNTGEAVQTVEVPDLNTGFESNVPGLYIVGELGGRGLIKNAVNEGRIAAEHVAAALRSAGVAGAAGDIADLVVVGAGPAGLSAALEAQRLDLRYQVVDQGSLADTIRKYPRKKILFAEPVKVPLYGNLWVSDGSKETLLQLWETIVAKTGLKVQSGRRVEDIIKGEDGFRVVTTSGDLRARKVILAMGRRGTPRRLGVPGEEAANVFYDIVEMETFRGRRVLVVGGGDSAVESVLGLANQPGTPVTLSYRGSELKRVKQRNRDKLEAKLAAGRIDLLLNSQVKEIRADSVLIEVNGETRSLDADEVIVRIGGIPPTDFLKRVGVGSVRKSLALSLGLLRRHEVDERQVPGLPPGDRVARRARLRPARSKRGESLRGLPPGPRRARVRTHRLGTRAGRVRPRSCGLPTGRPARVPSVPRVSPRRIPELGAGPSDPTQGQGTELAGPRAGLWFLPPRCAPGIAGGALPQLPQDERLEACAGFQS